ncbi:hypothetical protein J3A83DRAFT_4236816 [Scleroderma citrinum]
MDIHSPATDTCSLQALLIGSFISLIFYGISCVQTFFYLQTYPDDHILFKCLIMIIWVLESAHSGFMISFNNHYLINRFGDFQALEIISWDFVVDLNIGFILVLIVNSFFIWRVWVFSRKVWVVCLLAFLEIARYVLSTTPTSLVFHVDVTWKSFKDHAYVPLAVSMGVATLGDILIASILAYYLHCKCTQCNRQLITQILAYVVGTGALTSAFSIIKLISILASPNTLLYVSFKLIQVKIYANSVLFSFNLRQYQRKQSGMFPLGVSNIKPDDGKAFITPIY